MTLADGSLYNVPPSGVRISEPAHKFREVAIFFWIQHQMPVVWHKAVCKKSHIELLNSFFKDGFKELVVFVVIKNLGSCVSTVYDVIDETADVDSLNTRHTRIIASI